MSSAIKTPAFQAKASNILNEDNSSIYSAGAWSFKNASAVTGFHITASGNVGIGTTSPTSPLTIDKSYGFGARNVAIELRDVEGITGRTYLSPVESQFFLSTGGYYYGGGQYQLEDGKTAISSINITEGVFIFANTSGQTANSRVSLTERMRIDANGSLLVGTTAPTGGRQRLYLKDAGNVNWGVGPTSASGNFIIKNTSDVGAYISNGGTSWLAYSDERMKKNIKSLELGLEQIKALKPARFDYNNDESEASARVGFIAQEVLPVLPHAVSVPEDSEQMMGVSATEMIPVLVKAIQELSAQVEELKAKLP